MPRLLTALVVVLLAAVVTAPIAGIVPATAETPTNTPEPDGPLEPGDQLQSVVGVGEAEVGGDIEERAFALAFTDAETNSSKAAAVSERATSLANRIDRLEGRRDDLRAARDDGTIDESEFRARMAVLAARAETARRLAGSTANATRKLPAAALRQQDVDPASVRSLGRRASNLTGPELARAARSIGGNGVGRRIEGANRPNVTGPPPGVPGGGNGPPDRGNGTDHPGGGDGPPDDDDQGGPPDDDDGPGGFVLPPGALQSFEGGSGPLAVTDDEEGVPLFTVGLRPDAPARVTLQLTFDLTGDTDRRAFETLQEDRSARADVRDRFQNRMQSVADNTERRVDRNMTVSDADISLATSDDGDTGVVTLSIVWAEIAGRAGDDAEPNLVITEPFASGFTPSREFTVRVLAPDNYRLTRVTPDPMRQSGTSAAWAAGTSLDEFLLEFTPRNGTPLPPTEIEEFEPSSPTVTTETGDGLSSAMLSIGVVIAVAVAIGGYVAWRRRETG